MEPSDPLSQLAACCFGRRPRSAALDGGFRTVALRNQYFYSPSMAHMNMNAGTWPMFAQSATSATAVPQQPYLLLTQPVIMAPPNAAFAQQQQQQQLNQLQALAAYSANTSPLHKVASLLPTASQYAIYATTATNNGQELAVSPHHLSHQLVAPTLIQSSAIYESPRQAAEVNIGRTLSAYLNTPQVGGAGNHQHFLRQQQLAYLPNQSMAQQHKRRLNSDIFKRLELIEKQVDLSEDMDLVERHGIVITRSIEPSSLAPHLTDETLRKYQVNFLSNSNSNIGSSSSSSNNNNNNEQDDHVIRFIEIIKRPGQTLGLYIRAIQLERPSGMMAGAGKPPTRGNSSSSTREGIVITKIESDSPVYTSRVLHVGDEILSINLIDVQGMSLDDVVTLMSVPKRLVLVLRIPRERDYHHNLAPASLVRVGESRQVGQQNLLPSGQNTQPTIRGQDDDESMFSSSLENNRHCQEIQQPRHHNNQPIFMHSSSIISDNGQSVGLETYNHHHHQHHQMHTTERSKAPEFTQSSSQVLNFVRDMPQAATATTTTTIGNSDVEPYRHAESQRQARMLHQTAMNHLAESNDDVLQQASRGQTITTTTTTNLPGRPPPLLPRPFMMDHSMDSNSSEPSRLSFSNQLLDSNNTSTTAMTTTATTTPITSSTTKRPIINNIRLGDNPEQSSYFSSSIDAINRELKELRRQRMALSSNDPSVDEWESIINELRS